MASTSAKKMKNPTPRSKPYLEFLKRLIFDPSFPMAAMVSLFVAEVLVNIFVIWKIKYTEIDWKAYMQEVEGVVNGTFDYLKLKGDTGPLVYPAGFVYMFMGLYFATDHGTNIRLAQCFFVLLYLVNLLIVFDIYRIAQKIPPYALFFMCALSYRIHSIYILRLFNDPCAMIFVFIAISLFLRSHWSLGCLFYSFGVSIKMNVLLFAPALLFLLLITHGIKGTIRNLCICAIPQLVLAAPFLISNPEGYMLRSFDFGRQFFYIWTVNWRLLPEAIFLNRKFQQGLLVTHVIMLAFFFLFKWTRLFPKFSLQWSRTGLSSQLSADQILFPLFTANFIGMCFSRSLHYQFYVWYFHSLHYLVWCCPFPSILRVLILGLLEFSWNTYPSTVMSSAFLHLCHAFLLVGLAMSSSQPTEVYGSKNEAMLVHGKKSEANVHGRKNGSHAQGNSSGRHGKAGKVKVR